MKTPTSYSDWSVCIDALEAGLNDELVIQAMSQGSLSWTSGVANLFSERICGAFNIRLQRCADRMTRDLKLGADEPTLVRALLDSRRSLSFLHRVGTIPIFPQMLRDHLCTEVKRYAEKTQRSLEDSAKHDRSGRLASLIRHNNLLTYESPTNVAVPISNTLQSLTTSGNDTPLTPRRRMILD
jgi:hypothetical protein